MVGTTSVERILFAIMRDPNVTHFRMREPMHQLAIYQAPPANAGADREIEKRIQTLSSPPAGLPKRGCVDIGINATSTPSAPRG